MTPETAEVAVPDVVATASTEAQPVEQEASAIETKTTEPVVEEEEPDNSISYEEMLAQRAAKLVGEAKKARQVANDENRWKDVAPIVSEKEDNNEEEETVETSRKNTKKVLDVGTFVAPARESRGGGRGGRGGRGDIGGRGRGGRGGTRPAAVNLNDDSAFPALGRK